MSEVRAEAGAFGEDHEKSTASTTDVGAGFGPPGLLVDALDAASREGFYESAYRLLGKEMASVAKNLWKTREALAASLDRVSELEGEVGDWRSLAFEYGTETRAEKRERTNDLHGTLTLARDVVVMGGDDAIAYACADLARKLRAAAKTRPERAPVPAVDFSWSSPDAVAVAAVSPTRSETSDAE